MHAHNHPCLILKSPLYRYSLCLIQSGWGNQKQIGLHRGEGEGIAGERETIMAFLTLPLNRSQVINEIKGTKECKIKWLLSCKSEEFPQWQWLSGKESACNAGTSGDPGSIPGSRYPLEVKMATHSSTLAWRIPWTEEPGEQHSIGSQSWTWLKCLSSSIQEK